MARFLNRTLQLLIFAGLQFTVAHVENAVANEKEKNNSQGFHWKIINLGGLYYIQKFELGTVAPGKTLEALVRIENRLDYPITFEQVEASCKCTTSKVPQVTVKPGEEVDCSFRFKTSDSPRVLNEVYLVKIRYNASERKEPGPDTLQLGFSVNWDGVVAIRPPEVSVSYNEDSTESRFQVPIIVGPGGELNHSDIQFSQELRGVQHKLVDLDGKKFIEAWFAPRKFSAEPQVTGVLSLTTKNGFHSSSLVTLRREQTVEMAPLRLVFTPTSEGEYQRRATAFVRLRSPDSKRELSLREVTCNTENKKPLAVKFERVTGETYRIQVFASGSDELSSKDSLDWKVTTSSGEVFNHVTKCFIAN